MHRRLGAEKSNDQFLRYSMLATRPLRNSIRVRSSSSYPPVDVATPTPMPLCRPTDPKPKPSEICGLLSAYIQTSASPASVFRTNWRAGWPMAIRTISGVKPTSTRPARIFSCTSAGNELKALRLESIRESGLEHALKKPIKTKLAKRKKVRMEGICLLAFKLPGITTAATPHRSFAINFL